MATDERATQFEGKCVAFAGKLGGVNRREAAQLVRDQGGQAVALESLQADLIVIGADVNPLTDVEELLPAEQRSRMSLGQVEVVSETRFWELLGYFDEAVDRQLYTPAMLADWLDVPIGSVRRWIRRGLIKPAREIHRLAYFDFLEVTSARNLAQLVAAGASPAAIEQKLEQLARYVPDVERPLRQLSVIVEGRQILLREGEGLVEPSGQMRLDFEAREPDVVRPRLAVLADSLPEFDLTADDFVTQAAELEEAEDLPGAIETLRAALFAGGPNAETCFQLAELLYRTGDVTAARERYYAAIEIDDQYVEARHNLGCILAESGDLELAAASFEGALTFHPEYPDAHFQLARTLDQLERPEQADEHWRTFLRLAPSSPWADEARQRLSP